MNRNLYKSVKQSILEEVWDRLLGELIEKAMQGKKECDKKMLLIC